MPGHALPDGRIPVLLTAHEEDLIGHDAAAIRDYLGRAPQPVTPAAVAATLLRTRRVRRHRAVVRAADDAELAAGLAALADGDEHPLVARSSATAAPRTAFVFPGQGNQWPAMGAEAYQRIPVYRAEADRCAAAFDAAGIPSPLPYLVNEQPPEVSQLHLQGAQFTHAVAMAQLWRSCGVLPDLTVGHSLGEVAAAYAAGAITLGDAVAVVAARATVVDTLPGQYGMAVLGVGLGDAERLAAETTGWLEVSVVNAPSSTVLSGDRDAVAAVVRLAEQRGVFVREIAVDFPAHTSALETLRPTLARLLPTSAFLDTPVEFIGAATGAVVPAGTGFTDYWYHNLRNTVRFDRAVQAATQRGIGAFIELSAHPSLHYALSDLVDPDSGALILGSGRRDQPVVDEVSANIAAAALADPGYRWADVTGVTQHRPLPGFPNAPMRALHLWATPEPLADDTPAGPVLRTLTEAWQPAAPSVDNAETRCGIAVVGPDTAAAQRLRRAIAEHPHAQPAPPEQAEVVVVVASAVSQDDARAAAAELSDQPGAGLPDYHSLIGPACRSVWLLTASGERIGREDAPALPGQAALAAMHRCVGFEFADQAFGHLDLPGGQIDEATVRACVPVLLGEVGEVALRDAVRYTRILRETPDPRPARPLDAAALDTVVITGGGGAIGLRYARHCVTHGARRVILLSRSGVDPAVLAGLADGHRVEVCAPACDITDPDAVAAVAAAHAGAGASLLIHAAGVARFGPHQRLTAADRAAVFGAKVAGLAQITDIWPLRDDARILVCSSISGVWGGHGHGAYAAANRMLDVLTDRLRDRGLDATAVRWGLWQDAGIVDAAEITRIERSGLLAMDPDEALLASLRRHDGDPLILAADLDRLRVFFDSQGSPLPLAAAENPPAAAQTEQVPVADAVRAALAAALSLPGPAAVDLNAALIDLGVDSLLALDLRKRLRRGTGRSVPLASLLGGITGSQLIDALQPAESETHRPAERLESTRD
ncbi:mycobactin polyketide synthase MbtD [Mycobacterium sp. pUA109]|uniref:mycobactin polyketide synthase MbtD n=1 Tax=Mycobacterium sp. pUA109 TaxID=3238982 RepID=UPI00351AF119